MQSLSHISIHCAISAIVWIPWAASQQAIGGPGKDCPSKQSSLAAYPEEHVAVGEEGRISDWKAISDLINPAWTSPNEPFALLLFSLALQRSLSPVLVWQHHYYPHRRR